MSPIIDNYQEPSNEIEESIRAQRQQVPVTSRRKIKLLKRSDNEASANLLELLGPKRQRVWIQQIRTQMQATNY